MPPKLNRRRALFVLSKIDEILAWEQRKETDPREPTACPPTKVRTLSPAFSAAKEAWHLLPWGEGLR